MSMNVFVVAGEVSGDRAAAPVVAALRRRRPQLRFFGAGGPALGAEGVEILHDAAGLAVTGLTEPLAIAGRVAGMLAGSAREVRRRRPRLALLVDYPGVNLRLARWLARRGVPVLYFIAPQRWAWLGWRLRSLRACDRLAVTLPFEQRWFRARGLPATFVGNPCRENLALAPPAAARGELGIGAGERCLALLPGSRAGEVHRHAPLLRRVVRRLRAREPALLPLLAALPGEHAALCRRLAPELRQVAAHRALAAADAALCAVGTATLEAALAGVPSVAFYRMSRLSYAVARRLVRVPHVALPNLLLGRSVVPELLQREASVSSLTAAARAALEPDAAARQQATAKELARLLGPPGYAERVADLAEELL